MAPTTRSSIRQSLGKAIADVINKEGKDGDKATKKIKETRRLSAMNSKHTAPRNSMGEVRTQLQPVKRTGTPESTTLNHRRHSAAVHHEQPSKSNETTPPSGPVTRSSALRPSSRLNTISALPKYRPKSAASEIIKQPPSPPRASTRRRLRTSEDEKEDRPAPKGSASASTSSNRGARPISPLPHRILRKSTDVANPSPPPTPTRRTSLTPPTSSTLPSRPPKAAKTGNTSTASQYNIPRPSSSSSSCSGTPRTPKTAAKSSLRLSERDKTSEKWSSSVTSSPQRSEPDSPLARHRQRTAINLTHDSPTIGNMSHISEVTSDEEDVALLLAPVADPTAPTPAMPRITKGRSRDNHPPVTPARSGNILPSRGQMSYLSPLPPGESSSFLRPPALRPSGDERILRGSIMSWEQMANEASKILGEDEVHSMLSEVPAPFGSVPISPTISSSGMDIPDSPCLSALNSPGAFGSISQVLLPDSTPLPAIQNGSFKYDPHNDLGAVDGAIVTLLRLQLCAAENTAKERLTRLQMMEEELHNLKGEHRRETLELSLQVSRLQEHLCEKEEYEERIAVEKAAYTTSLEEQIREAQAVRDKAIQDGIERFKQHERESRAADFRLRHVLNEATCAARVAQAGWDSVHALSEAELEMVRGDRQLLFVVLAELDRMVLIVP